MFNDLFVISLVILVFLALRDRLSPQSRTSLLRREPDSGLPALEDGAPDDDVFRINPATGLPMLPGAHVDVEGNLYGLQAINPATGFPMAWGSSKGFDVAGNPYGQGQSLADMNNDFP